MNEWVKSLSRVRLFAAPWTIAYQDPLSMGFSRQEYWSGLPFPSPGDLPNPGIEPRSPALQADASPSKPLLQLSKPLIQFSIVGWSYVPSLLFTWGQTMVEVVKIMATSFKRSHACIATLSDPSCAAGHCWPTPLPETPGHSCKSGSVSCGVTAPFSWVLVHTRFCLCKYIRCRQIWFAYTYYLETSNS